MDKTQKEKIREKFEEKKTELKDWLYGTIYKGYDQEETAEVVQKDVDDFFTQEWFDSIIDLAIKETEERLVRDIEEYEKTADEHVEPNEVYICCQDILALIRNK